MGSWNWTFRLVEKLLIWRYIHPARTCLLSSQSPASKHGGQLLNKVFICSKDITPSRTSRIFETMGNFQNECCHPWTKNLLKNLSSRLLGIRYSVVRRQQVRLIDQNLFSSNYSYSFLGDDDNCKWAQQRQNKSTGLIYFSQSLIRLVFYCRTRWVNCLTIVVV